MSKAPDLIPFGITPVVTGTAQGAVAAQVTVILTATIFGLTYGLSAPLPRALLPTSPRRSRLGNPVPDRLH